MRNALLRAAPFVLAAASCVLWLWPVAKPAPPEAAALDPSPPSAAASPASNEATLSQPSTAPAPIDLSAEQLTERAEQQLASNPGGALADITRADALDGPDAAARHEARRALHIQALVRVGQVGHARTLTDRFYRTFPNSSHAAELERLTGYHPRPTAP
jgi:hypothetical protein